MNSLVHQISSAIKHSRPRVASARWALVLVLAGSAMGWMVYQGVSQQVNAQIAPAAAQIVYPVANEQLLWKSRYTIHYTAVDPGSVIVEFWVRNKQGTEAFVGLGVPSGASPYKYTWTIPEATSGTGFLENGSNIVTLIAKVGGNPVDSRTINIWKGSSTPVYGSVGPVVTFDWAKPVEDSQTFGDDQKALILKWTAGAFFPRNESGSTFYNGNNLLLGLGYYYPSDQPLDFNLVKIFTESPKDTNNTLLEGKEYLWSNIPPDFTNQRKLEVRFYSYSNQRGLPLPGETFFGSPTTMQDGKFMDWEAPKADLIPPEVPKVQPKGVYQLQWQLNDAANAPISGLRLDISLDYTNTNNQLVKILPPQLFEGGFKGSDFGDPYGTPGIYNAKIPADVQRDSNLDFHISIYRIVNGVRQEFSYNTATFHVAASPNSLSVELITPTPIKTAPDYGVVKPVVVDDQRRFVLSWNNNSALASSTRVDIKYVIDDNPTVEYDVTRVGAPILLSAEQYPWINPLEFSTDGQKNAAQYIGRRAHFIFRTVDGAYEYKSYPIVFGGRLSIVTPATGAVISGQPYTIDWTYQPAGINNDPAVQGNTLWLKIYYSAANMAQAAPITTISPADLGATSFDWNVPAGLESRSDYQFSFVWVYNLSDGIQNAQSNFKSELFTIGSAITPGAIDIIYPNGTTALTKGQTYDIQWEFNPLPDVGYRSGDVKYYYALQSNNPSYVEIGQGESIAILVDATEYTDSYSWAVNIDNLNPANNSYIIKVEYTPDASGGSPVVTVSEVFAINNPVPPTPQPLAGTYFSALMALDSEHPTFGPLSFDRFRAVSSNLSGTEVKFGLKFYNEAGVLKGVNQYHPTGQYDLILNEVGEADLSDFENILASEFNQIRQVQFVIYMSTEDYLTSMPWVQSVSLDYSMPEQVLGIINFNPNTLVNYNQTVNPDGATITFNLEAIPSVDLEGTPNIVLDVNWTAGSEPAGIVINMPVILNIFSTGPSRAFEFQVTADDNAIAGDYTFTITGHGATDVNRTLTPSATGTLTVGGTLPVTPDFSLEWVGPISQQVRAGSSVTYLILAKSLNGFAEEVSLTTNISGQFMPLSTAVTGQFFPSTPFIPTAAGSEVLLTVSVAAGTPDQGPNAFTVTGTSGDSTNILSGATLLISDTAPEHPGITINATVTMEGTRGVDQPQFFFRLYPQNAATRAAKVFQKTGILPSEFVNDALSIDVPEGLVSIGGQYTGYLRSTRHLWKKSTSNITINATTTDYSMAFGLASNPMVMGNVGPNPASGNFLEDDEINSLDYTNWYMEFVGGWLTKYADFNGDGAVNTSDITSILGQLSGGGSRWEYSGDLQTNLPN
ncbi:hypothetical protein A2994_01535 [candidate division Kazan bacterium RIFCSPLOWO2_01_FULL_48_13]|uniref:Dockerin domain-containing protein n=1 Tax=candidate division Kazan bacterium RIFCSPLOWO2_01_FULL_48_13 TaxID=1798539 RepID=A0A1F4PP86_UNCK3|nr:MAG: hypothetical protein A2994_01535 [candidate division Kazan bacterium RIFCSPLOWO2_01_FULL_48_13]